MVAAAADVPPAGGNCGSMSMSHLQETAARMGIVALKRLTGIASLRPYRKEGLTLDCRFEADLGKVAW